MGCQLNLPYIAIACFYNRPYFDKYGEDFLAEYTSDSNMKILKAKANKERLKRKDEI